MSFLFPSEPDSGQKMGDSILGAGDFGKDLPWVFGCGRVPSINFWQDLVPAVRETSSGSKGSLFAPASGVQKVYTGSCAHLFCLAPDPSVGIFGFRKLWQDNTLVYNVADDASAASLDMSAKFLARMAIYLGTDTQGADPTIAAAMTTALTSGQRGIANIVFNSVNWPNGRVPTYIAEICQTGSRYPAGTYVLGNQIQRQPCPLSTILRTLCLAVKIPIGNIDVSAVVPDVKGIVISKANIKQSVEALLKFYDYDILESGYNVEFFPIDRPVVVNIPYRDMQTVKAGDDVPKNDLGMRDIWEQDMPIQINLRAKNIDNDYMPIVQPYTKPSGNALNIIDVDLGDFSATPTDLAGVAQKQLYRAYIERISPVETDLSITYLPYEVGDVATQTTQENIVLTTRFNKITIGGDDFIHKTESVMHAGASFTATAIGAGQSGGLSLSSAGNTTWLWLNLPPLHDAEALSPGVYVAVASSSYGWKSATLNQSKDGGSTYAGVLTLGSTGIIGSVTGSALVDGQTFTWENGAAVRVTVAGGHLVSVTDDQLSAGANMCLIGGELLQFGTATVVSAGVYDLTHRLRGRRATEQYAVGHGAAENFVLLTDTTGALAPGIGFLTCGYGDLNRADLWKMVSNGQALADVSAESHFISGQNMIPFNPVNINTGLDMGSGHPNMHITWQRRSRLGSVLTSGQEIPLGETTERYHFEIMHPDGSAFLDRPNLTTNSFDYNSGDRAFDLGSADASMIGYIIRVRQWSSTMGDGASSTLVLTLANSGT